MRLAHGRASADDALHAPRGFDDVRRHVLDVVERAALHALRHQVVERAIVDHAARLRRGVAGRGPHRQVHLERLGKLALVRQDAHTGVEAHGAQGDLVAIRHGGVT